MNHEQAHILVSAFGQQPTTNMRDVLMVSFARQLWWMDFLEVHQFTLDDGAPGWRVSGWYLDHYLRCEHRFCSAVVRDLRALRARVDAEHRSAWSA